MSKNSTFLEFVTGAAKKTLEGRSLAMYDIMYQIEISDQTHIFIWYKLLSLYALQKFYENVFHNYHSIGLGVNVLILVWAACAGTQKLAKK